MNDHIICDKKRIELSSILWLEGDWNYTRIYQQGESVYLSAYTLKWYERHLTEFVRVRKNAIVNPLHVRALKSISSRPRRLQLILSNGELVEVTRRRQAMTRRWFNTSLLVGYL